MVNGNCSQRQRLKYNTEQYKGYFSSYTYPAPVKPLTQNAPIGVNVSNPSTPPYFYFGKRGLFDRGVAARQGIVAAMDTTIAAHRIAGERAVVVHLQAGPHIRFALWCLDRGAGGAGCGRQLLITSASRATPRRALIASNF